jgi:hypothetical protein
LVNFKQIISQLPIPRDNKDNLNLILENNQLYLKSKYGRHCGDAEQTTTHCTIYGLSQANNPFSRKCVIILMVCFVKVCSTKEIASINANNNFLICCHLECISVAEMFDQIEDAINTIAVEETKGELLYDFKLALDSVFQLMGHRIRAAQQEHQKEKYLGEMDETTAFLTVDWSQKILPQQFREGQSSYFGKKGMSVLVGSFLFKQPSDSKRHKIILKLSLY